MTTTLDRRPARAPSWLSHGGSRRVPAIAFALVVVAAVIRAGVVFSGGFYWDDLILIGRAGTFPAWSETLLRYDHDGHFMPAAFLVAELVTAVGPLRWAPAAVTLVAGQVVASFAVLRVLWLLLGWRRALSAPLLFYLLTPLTLPAFAWWAAGLNALPLQAALAWVAGDALQYTRTRRRRHLASALAVTALALLFFEKSVLVPFVAFATVALTHVVDGRSRPFRRTVRDGGALWAGSAVLLALWLGVYLTTVESRFAVPPLEMARALTHHGISFGLLPTLIGGPWQWDRWNPGPPWADPPMLLVVVSWIALAAAAVWCLRRRPRTVSVWLSVAAYVVASLVAMIATRVGPDTTYTLARTLRYFADSAVVITIGAALILRAPQRPASPRPVPVSDRAWRCLAGSLAGLFTTGSLWSTATFTAGWADNPTGDYLDTAKTTLAANQDVPVLDHPVSVWVLLPVAHPHNMIGSVFAALDERPAIGTSTTRLRVLDDTGALVPADLLAVRHIGPGPEPGCGHRLTPGGTTTLPTGPVIDSEWTARLDYLASRDGTIEVGFPGAAPTRVGVERGPGAVYVRVPGGGHGLQITTGPTGPNVCVAGGALGVVVPH